MVNGYWQMVNREITGLNYQHEQHKGFPGAGFLHISVICLARGTGKNTID
jgi:hypothetical protein